MNRPATKKQIENTERTAEENPLGVIAAAAVFGPSGAIEFQEAVGQRELVHGDQLPSEMHGLGTYRDAAASRRQFESLGFKFGDPDPSDPLFLPATLPPGWSKRGSSHSMWSDVVDEKGRVRVAVFYKAAFYDRRATMSIRARYATRNAARDERGEKPPGSKDRWVVVDDATGAALQAFEEVNGEKGYEAYGRASDWLREHCDEITLDWDSEARVKP